MLCRNVPDVLFVDEEGNPIEAGHELILYVDEAGNEIPEEIAMQLLDSDKYIDSRDLYQDNDATSSGQDAISQGVFDTSQASLPASAFDLCQSQLALIRSIKIHIKESLKI